MCRKAFLVWIGLIMSVSSVAAAFSSERAKEFEMDQLPVEVACPAENKGVLEVRFMNRYLDIIRLQILYGPNGPSEIQYAVAKAERTYKVRKISRASKIGFPASDQRFAKTVLKRVTPVYAGACFGRSASREAYLQELKQNERAMRERAIPDPAP